MAAPSCASSLGRVPAIGRVSTSRPRTLTNRSGELETMHTVPSSAMPANGAGLARRSLAYSSAAVSEAPSSAVQLRDRLAW